MIFNFGTAIMPRASHGCVTREQDVNASRDHPGKQWSPTRGGFRRCTIRVEIYASDETVEISVEAASRCKEQPLARRTTLFHGSAAARIGRCIRGPFPDPGQPPYRSKRTKTAVITSRSSGTE